MKISLIICLFLFISCNSSDRSNIAEEINEILEDIQDPDGTNRKYLSDKKEAKQLFSEAFKYTEKEQYYNAIKKYKEAIEKHPAIYFAAYNNLAHIYYYSEDFRDYHLSIKYANKPILDKSVNTIIKSKCYWIRGMCKENLFDKTGSLDDYTKSIELAKQSNSEDRLIIFKSVYMLRGNLNHELDNNYNACEDWSKAGTFGNKDAYDKISQYCN